MYELGKTSNSACSSCRCDWHNNGLFFFFFHWQKRWPAIISRFPPLVLSSRQEESCTCHNTASPGLSRWLYNDHEEESICLSSWKQCQSFFDYDKRAAHSFSYHRRSVSTRKLLGMFTPTQSKVLDVSVICFFLFFFCNHIPHILIPDV